MAPDKLPMLMTVPQAHAVCARRLREALDAPDSAAHIAKDSRPQLAKQMREHERLAAVSR